MANKEIIGGLRSALERGESVKGAAQTFVNAGYDSKEVEDAVREFESMGGSTMMPSAPKAKPSIKPLVSSYGDKKMKPMPKPKKSKEMVPEGDSKVSSYKGKSPKKKLTILVIVFVLVLLGILGGLFFVLKNLL